MARCSRTNRTCTCSSGWLSSVAARCNSLNVQGARTSVLAFRFRETRQAKKNREDERSNPDRPNFTRAHRAFRRPDRGRRHLRRWRGLSPHDAMPGNDVRGVGGPEDLWRHLDHPPLSRHPLRQRPAHLRLSLQAVDVSAAEILKYMGDVIEENDLSRHIRYQHTITSAEWSSEENLWTIEATRTDTGEKL